jgi:hypothetical protein
MMKLSEELTIDSSPDVVFDVMTDFASYGAWNPWIVEASGTPREGEIVRVAVKLGKRTTRVDHRVLTNRRTNEFRWCDVGWFTVCAYGERARFLEPAPSGGVRYRVELTIKGPLTSLVRVLYGDALATGLKAETLALKERAEALRG